MRCKFTFDHVPECEERIFPGDELFCSERELECLAFHKEVRDSLGTYPNGFVLATVHGNEMFSRISCEYDNEKLSHMRYFVNICDVVIRTNWSDDQIEYLGAAYFHNICLAVMGRSKDSGTGACPAGANYFDIVNEDYTEAYCVDGQPVKRSYLFDNYQEPVVPEHEEFDRQNPFEDTESVKCKDCEVLEKKVAELEARVSYLNKEMEFKSAVCYSRLPDGYGEDDA